MRDKTENTLSEDKKEQNERLKCENNKSKLDTGDKEIRKTRNNIKYRIVFDVSKVKTVSTEGKLIPKNVKINIKIELPRFKTSAEFFAKTISKEYDFVLNDNSKKEILRDLKDDVIRAGWKNFSEYIERGVFPFFYAESKLSRMCAEDDPIKGFIYRPIKILYERLKKAQRGSIIRVQEKIALLMLFNSLMVEKPTGKPQLWTGLKTCLRENISIPCRECVAFGEVKPCREYVIYQTIFPYSTCKTFEWGRGIRKPKKVSLSDIREVLKKARFFEEDQTIRNLCKKMNVILYSKRGRKKKN